MKSLLRWSLIAFCVLSTKAVASTAFAGDVLPGEKTELTPEVRAEADKQLAIIKACAKEDDVVKARTALLRMGPVVWPVVDNAVRLTTTDGPKPHLNYLKALLLPKADAEFEYLRAQLRRTALMGNPEAFRALIQSWKRGTPDPTHPGKTLPLKATPTALSNGAKIYRSADGTIVLAFGVDAVLSKEPKKKTSWDGGDVTLEDGAAGFAAAIAGTPLPADRLSGRGGNAVVHATNGYACGWATDGAKGAKGGGQGGDAGSAEVKGGAGSFGHPGNGGDAGDG